MSIQSNADALQALSSGMNVIAHNIANVSTPGFEPLAFGYTSGPDNQSVRFLPPHDNQIPAAPEGAVAAGRHSAARGSGGDDGHTGLSGVAGGLEASNVDVARELTTMMITQRAFEANTRPVRTIEEMTGTVINLIS